MELEWRRIPEFPSYVVSNYGHVMNEETGHEVRQSSTGSGVRKVNLHRDNRWFTKSVKVLVARCFVEGESDVFDTPILLDGNRENIRADNIMWRPRWFAWKYSHQFENIKEIHKRGPVVEIHSGTVYRDVLDAATFNGLLIKDVWRSIHFINPPYQTFPTWQEFKLKRAE